MRVIHIDLNEKPFAINYKEALANAHKMLEELEMDLEKETHEELSEELTRVDLMEQDVLHIIELMNFNAVEGFKFAKMLQEIRKARRKIKDRFEERRELKEFMSFYKSSGFKMKLGNSLNKAENLPKKQVNREYRLRELTELEGFNKVIKEQKAKLKASQVFAS